MKKQKKNSKPSKKDSKKHEVLRSVLGRNRNLEGQLNFYKGLVAKVREILTNEGVSSYPRYTDAEMGTAIMKLVKSLRHQWQVTELENSRLKGENRILSEQLANQNSFARLCEGDGSKPYISYNTTMPSGLGKCC